MTKESAVNLKCLWGAVNTLLAAALRFCAPKLTEVAHRVSKRSTKSSLEAFALSLYVGPSSFPEITIIFWTKEIIVSIGLLFMSACQGTRGLGINSVIGVRSSEEGWRDGCPVYQL